jgi:hypothetical protein
LSFEHAAHYIVLEDCIAAVEAATARRDHLEAHIEAALPDWSLTPVVKALQALRGLALVAAATLVAELGDITRFANPRQFMAYLGLVRPMSAAGDSAPNPPPTNPPPTNPPPTNPPHQGQRSNDGPFWDFKASHYVTAVLTAALIGVGVVQILVYNKQAAMMKAQNVISTQQAYIDVAQTGISNRQLEITKSQTSLMAFQERPWIKANLVVDGDFVFQPGIGYFAPFHLNLTNIGHLPAFDVRSGVYPYTPQKAGEDMIAVWRERCKATDKESEAVPTFGTVLFPEEKARSDRDTPARSVILSVEQVNNGLQFSSHGDRFDLRIMGCVIYTDSTGARYQTGINYSIWTINPNDGWNVGINPHERIPSAGVTPIMFHISSGMTY